MAKLTLNDIVSGYGTAQLYNANNTLIEAAIENTLSRDGTSPNTMSANIDMNSNKVVNLAEPTNNNDAARKVDLDAVIAAGLPDQTAHANQVLGTDGTTASWLTPTAANITNVPAGTIAAVTVQAAIDELASDAATDTTNLSNHLADTTDAHDASAISNVPAGIVTSTDVQAAINEIATLASGVAIAYASTSGTDTYTITLSPAIAGYVTGADYRVNIASTNTGPSTINFNALGAKTIVDTLGNGMMGGELSGQHTLRYDGTNMVVLDPQRIVRTETRRQTVITGAVDSNGQANFLSAGTGLAVTMAATTTPVTATFAAGDNGYGQINYRERFSADQTDYWSSLPASNLSFLMLDRNSTTGAVSAYNTLVPPQYGQAFDKTKQALLHFEGAGASTTITDEYGNTWTVTNQAQIDTAQFKFGAASLLLDGAGDHISMTGITTFGGDSWTMEAFVRFNQLPEASGQNDTIFAAVNGSNYGALLSMANVAGVYKLAINLSSNGTSNDIATNEVGTDITWSTGVWYHFAFTYDAVAGKYFVYVDGVKDYEKASASRVCSFTSVAIGKYFNANYTELNGWVDEFRLSTCCRYPNGTAFTPPAAAFTPDSEWFDLSEFKWKYGGPTTGWTEKQRVCVGETTTGAATVSSVTTYALRGMYESAYATFALNTAYSKAHNIGVRPNSMQVFGKCLLPDSGWAVGDELILADPHLNTTAAGFSLGSNRVTTNMATGSGNIVFVPKAGGSGTMTVTSWVAKLLADRGW